MERSKAVSLRVFLHNIGNHVQPCGYEPPPGRDFLSVSNCQVSSSVFVQLAAPDEYQGGDVELQWGPQPNRMPKERGTLILFPSYTLHRVKAVKEGIRRSLVGWVNGPEFR